MMQKRLVAILVLLIGVGLGRVVAQVGYDQASGIDGFELGGYPLVADALHGWVRDDAWVFGNAIWRVVARPIEIDSSSAPAGVCDMASAPLAPCWMMEACGRKWASCCRKWSRTSSTSAST